MPTSRSTLLTVTLALAILLLFPASGCKPAASLPPVVTFVGPVENSDAFIALSRVGESVLAYVCDGGSTATWLKGEASGSAFDLASGEARLRATIRDGRLEGTFTSVQGGAHAFVARPAASGAGFYRAAQTAAGVAYVGGWILLRDGQQRGAVKADGAILSGPKPTLDPSRPEVALPGGEVLVAESVETMLAPSSLAVAPSR